jgi:hypothetical protein
MTSEKRHRTYEIVDNERGKCRRDHFLFLERNEVISEVHNAY